MQQQACTWQWWRAMMLYDQMTHPARVPESVHHAAARAIKSSAVSAQGLVLATKYGHMDIYRIPEVVKVLSSLFIVSACRCGRSSVHG